MMNLLVQEGFPTYASIPEVLLYALIGFGVVFVGIAVLVLVIKLVGKVMQKTPNKEKNPSQNSEEKAVAKIENTQSDEISEETIAVITAALMAYYERQGKKCEFIVKRIRKV